MKPYVFHPRSWVSGASLRVKVALGVMLPVLLTWSLLSLAHYRNERLLLDDELELTAAELGAMMSGSVRHAMLENDPAMLQNVLADVGRMENVSRVQIIGLDDRVAYDSGGQELGALRRTEEAGCVECHRFPPQSRPRTARLPISEDLMRISTPIGNGPECSGCHEQNTSHLGVLLLDVSFLGVETHVLHNLRNEVAVLIGGAVLGTVAMSLLIHRFIVRRVEAFHRPLAEFAAGEFSARLPAASGANDELGQLAGAFNQMAEALQRHEREQEERNALRQRAIIEERERIARELHDGLAQLLGFVNTKTIAARLTLKSRRLQETDQHLLRLEEAVREMFVEVREAILGLRMAGRGEGLVATLKDFAAQFSRLNNLPVEVIIQPETEHLPLAVEAELHLLRIIQEALANVRKHASAAKAQVSLRIDGGILELAVSDDGVGFDPEHVCSDRRPRFGLGTMHERAESIGADFRIVSRPSEGTRVTVRLALKES